MDAADHEAQPRLLRVCGHEAEGGHALEHRRLGRTQAADLEEVVHDPDRVEPDVVRGAGHARQGGADGGSPPPGQVKLLTCSPNFGRARRQRSTLTPCQKAT